jgi:hypothetical protein
MAVKMFFPHIVKLVTRDEDRFWDELEFKTEPHTLAVGEHQEARDKEASLCTI